MPERKPHSRRKTLYWQLIIIFSSLVASLGGLFLFISANYYQTFHLEVEQRLAWELASAVAEEIQPHLLELPDFVAVERQLHALVSHNLRVEPFILDDTGAILISVDEIAQLPHQRVPLPPLAQFIESNPITSPPLANLDPRETDTRRLFSAAPITIAGKPGYVYIVFSSSHHDTLTEWFSAKFYARSFLLQGVLAICATAGLGIFLFQRITRRFEKLTQGVAQFSEGDLSVRLADSSEDEIGVLTQNFNAMATTIETMVRRLEETDQKRRELIASVSHDFRSPLTSIHGYLQKFLQENATHLDESGHQHLAVISRNVDHLKRLTSQLFELAKLEANEVTPHLEDIDWFGFAEDILERLQQRATEAKVSLHLEESSISIAVDPYLFERVIINLLDNALRYTPEGGTVSLSAHKDLSGSIITISDTGAGIPPEDVPRIFEIFYRVEKARERHSGGSGLGLAIVKRIVEAHGGEITCQSEVGVGTTFTIALPKTMARTETSHTAP